MARNFKELLAKMSPESRARSEAKAHRMLQDMSLDELRAARTLTQENLCVRLQVKQSTVSKLERRADMYVSTLRHFIEALGGELEIRAVFPDREDVRITQFRGLSAKTSPRRAHTKQAGKRPPSGRRRRSAVTRQAKTTKVVTRSAR
jgi:transcriptional regulator with XRE-family HTH domain